MPVKRVILFLFIVSQLMACSRSNSQETRLKNNINNHKMENKMKVEIWSDIMCPFCYIGKRKFEAALTRFPHKNNVQLVWKSFQLTPDLKTQPGKSIHQFLSEHKGMSIEQAKAMNDKVTQMASEVGLVYNFDKSIVANSFNAHRFIHFAKQQDKQDEAEELLFRSYFTDGKNIDDYATLVQLGVEIGLNTVALKTALENGSYADDVRTDILEAQQLGVTGVPFFVFDRKYAISGAQESQAFLEALTKSFDEWSKQNPQSGLEIIEGQSCKPGGECK